jgi:uncharacterized RDD family membrane protein YckC
MELPMDDDNPYAPPISDLIVIDEKPGKDPLADRGARLVAAILDAILGMAYGFTIMYLLGIWSYALQGQNPPFSLVLIATVPSFLCFLLIHGYFLKKNGQTIGKKLLGIRISDLEGNVPSFGKIILLRYLPVSLVPLIPLVGSYLSLIDTLFIFRSDRRCLHDLIAGTKVVVAKSNAHA